MRILQVSVASALIALAGWAILDQYRVARAPQRQGAAPVPRPPFPSEVMANGQGTAEVGTPDPLSPPTPSMSGDASTGSDDISKVWNSTHYFQFLAWLESLENQQTLVSELSAAIRGEERIFKIMLERTPHYEPRNDSQLRLGIVTWAMEYAAKKLKVSEGAATDELLEAFALRASSAIREPTLPDYSTLRYRAMEYFALTSVSLGRYVILRRVIKDLRNEPNVTQVLPGRSLPRSARGKEEETRDAMRETFWEVYKTTTHPKVKASVASRLGDEIAGDDRAKSEFIRGYWNLEKGVRDSISGTFHAIPPGDPEVHQVASDIVLREDKGSAPSEAMAYLAKSSLAANSDAIAVRARTFLSDRSYLMRVACARYLGKFGDAKDLAVLETMATSDSEKDVRESARNAVEALKRR